MNVPPWSSDLHSVTPAHRDVRDPSRAVPVEPTVVQPQDDNFFAVRVEIVTGDRRRVVSAPPVYVAPISNRIPSASQLPSGPRAAQLGTGERTNDAPRGLAPRDDYGALAEPTATSTRYAADPQRAFAAYGAQVQLYEQQSSDRVGQHVRVRA